MVSNRLKKIPSILAIPVLASLGVCTLESLLKTPQIPVNNDEVRSSSVKLLNFDFIPPHDFVRIEFCRDIENLSTSCNIPDAVKLTNIPITVYRDDGSSYFLLTDYSGAVTITDSQMIGYGIPAFIFLNNGTYECSYNPILSKYENLITVTTSFWACTSGEIEL